MFTSVQNIWNIIEKYNQERKKLAQIRSEYLRKRYSFNNQEDTADDEEYSSDTSDNQEDIFDDEEDTSDDEASENFENRCIPGIEMCLRKASIQDLHDLHREHRIEDFNGSLIQFCLANRWYTVLELLFKKGIDVNVVLDNVGTTPLMQAVANVFGLKAASVRFVKFLLESGADVNKTTKEQDATALHSAVGSTCDIKGQYRLEIIKLLLQYGANPNAATVEKITPLYQAVSSNLLEEAKILLDYSADVDTCVEQGYYKGMTPWSHAIHNNSFRMVKCLLDGGADPNISDICHKNRKPLHFAVAKGNLAIVKLLVLKGTCDLNAVDTNGTTPLHIIASYGKKKNVRHYKSIITLLLGKGAGLYQKDKAHKAPIDYLSSDNVRYFTPFYSKYLKSVCRRHALPSTWENKPDIVQSFVIAKNNPTLAPWLTQSLGFPFFMELKCTEEKSLFAKLKQMVLSENAILKWLYHYNRLPIEIKIRILQEVVLFKVRECHQQDIIKPDCVENLLYHANKVSSSQSTV